MREHGKTILDLIKYLPDQSQWPLRMARPIRHSSKEVGENVEQVIQRAVQETQIPKEVLLRKNGSMRFISMWYFITMSKICLTIC